jgi:hypothetical protein
MLQYNLLLGDFLLDAYGMKSLEIQENMLKKTDAEHISFIRYSAFCRKSFERAYSYAY